MSKNIKKANVRPFDVEELACKILGLDYDEIDADTQVIEEKLEEEFSIDLSVFGDIISRLLPLVDVGKSPLTGVIHRGFADVENKCWLVKEDIN
jgi:hypothetical protein